MTNFKQLKNLLIGEMSHLEQKIGRFKFLVLQEDIKLKMAADAKRRRSSFIMHVKESCVNSSMF